MCLYNSEQTALWELHGFFGMINETALSVLCVGAVTNT